MDEIPTSIKPYGDHLGDGWIQMSFTLPIGASEQARYAAQMYVEKLGLKNVKILHMEDIDKNYTFFVVYATSDMHLHLGDVVVPKLEYPILSFDEINNRLHKDIGRKVVVLGACIGTDAHTVGIDAIFNMKGYLGDHGLERYPELKAVNLRAQVNTMDLVNKIIELKADAVLVSRVVTQQDSHITELKKFLQELKDTPGVPAHLIKICGGPRLTHREAIELGYDAGFGTGTKPSQVASYLAAELVKRLKGQGAVAHG